LQVVDGRIFSVQVMPQLSTDYAVHHPGAGKGTVSLRRSIILSHCSLCQSGRAQPFACRRRHTTPPISTSLS
jgi:hypothetical protein